MFETTFRSMRLSSIFFRAIRSHDLPTAVVCTAGILLNHALGSLVVMALVYLVVIIGHRLARRGRTLVVEPGPARHVRIAMKLFSVRILVRAWKGGSHAPHAPRGS